MASLKQLIHEIHRRSLWQVLGIYAVGSWVALQVVDVLAQNFGLPAWFPPFALSLLVIGLPIVLATAFIQEGVGARPGPGSPESPDARSVAPEGRSHERPADGSVHGRLLTWRNAITGGLAAVALWGVIATAWLLFGSPGREPAAAAGGLRAGEEVRAENRRSIAVLPFASVRSDEESRSFVSGIHDDILTQLSKIAGLKVISRTSVLQYEGTQKTIGEIGSELGVATVMEGGVQRSGDRVRVNVQLIDARTDQHLWAESYDQELTAANVFAIQSDIARQIARALEAALAPDVSARLAQRPTESLEAYDLYLRGRYLLDKTTKEAFEDAIELYERAIAADPAFALAYTGLADAYLSLAGRGFLPTSEAVTKARAAAERAMALDEGLAEAHTSLARTLDLEGRWEDAQREYQRAIELNPGYALARIRYAGLLQDRSRTEEALAQFEIAAELDPRSRLIRANVAFSRFYVRDYAGTVEEALALIELEPAYSYGYYILGVGQSFLGRNQEAIAAGTRAVELEPDDLYNLAMLAFVNARAGNRESAIDLAGQVEERGGSLKEVALVYGALGEMNRAFEYLERAYESDPSDMSNLNVDPSADPLRADPRFLELLQRLGLE